MVIDNVFVCIIFCKLSINWRLNNISMIRNCCVDYEFKICVGFRFGVVVGGILEIEVFSEVGIIYIIIDFFRVFVV